MRNPLTVKMHCGRQKHVSDKSNHSAVQKAENSATSQSVIGEKNLAQNHERRITPNNRRFPMDARKVIGPLAGFRQLRRPTRTPEEGSPAASQSANGEKRLVRFVRRTLARQVKDTRRTARCRATSHNAIGEKDLAMDLQRTIRPQ